MKFVKPTLLQCGLFLLIIACLNGDRAAAWTGVGGGRNGDHAGEDSKLLRRFLQTVNGRGDTSDRQPPSATPCCLPKSWQSIGYGYEGNFDGEIYFETFVDAKNLQLVRNITKRPAKSISSNEYLIVHSDASSQTSIVYLVDFERKLCRKYNITASFDQLQPQCPPAGAVFGGDFNMGGGEASFPLQSWMWTYIDLPPMHLDFERLVTAYLCLPVMEFIRGRVGDKVPVLETVNYFNVATPVKDPTVFTPPSYCDGVRLVKPKLLRKVDRHFFQFGGYLTPEN